MSQLAKTIAKLCPSTWNRHYIESKLNTDPLYNGVLDELSGRTFPLLDIGCGMGLLAYFLREHSYQNPVTGIDFDERKIDLGHKMLQASNYADIHLSQGDAREQLPPHSGDVTILDILQFFTQDQQRELLAKAAASLAPGSKLIIRSGLADDSWRFRLTRAADHFANLTFWMKTSPTTYPTADFFQSELESLDLKVSIKPFWGKTPFNNYLIVAEKQP